MNKIVYIEWFDHCTHTDSWTDKDKVGFNVCMVKSVGFIVNETKDLITLAIMEQVDGSPVSGCLSVLKKCIRRRKDIKIKPRPSNKW